jgi:hypothetical protein
VAQCVRFVCPKCTFSIDAWSDGNPYYFDEAGKKTYAYHPDHERLARCVGNDVPHICLACAEEFVLDSRSPRPDCPKCESSFISATYDLAGKRCPACHQALLEVDADFQCVS